MFLPKCFIWMCQLICPVIQHEHYLLVKNYGSVAQSVYINCQLVFRKQQYRQKNCIDAVIAVIIGCKWDDKRGYFLTSCSIWANIFHSYNMRVKCDASRHSVFLSWSQSTALWILQLLIADTTICIRRTQCFRSSWKWLRFKSFFFLFFIMKNMDIVQFLWTRHIKLSLNLK